MKIDSITITKLAQTLLILICSTLLGCTTRVVVNGYFPAPVVEPLPLTVSVVYHPDFAHYRYIEQDEQREEKEISMGKAQVELFNTVLTGMFEHVVYSDAVTPSNDNPVDMFFYPLIDEFQYNMPVETKINMFEVWIKYHLKVFDGQGNIIADWIQTAYGKTPTAMFKSKERALNEAMIVALRDVGAGFILRFNHVPEIQQWLKQRQQLSAQHIIKKPVHHSTDNTAVNNANVVFNKTGSLVTAFSEQKPLTEQLTLTPLLTK